MRVLVACEESQEVCKAFRALGHEAYSCDLQEPSGGHPEWHILGDALVSIQGGRLYTMDGQAHDIPAWDMIIAHPPCTYITSAGACRLFDANHNIKDRERERKGWLATDFFWRFYMADCDRIAIENPAPLKYFALPAYTQIIEPYMFGDPWKKRTCLWLKGLQPLVSTNVVQPKGCWTIEGGGSTCRVKLKAGWCAKNAKERSKTFPGIARAMAEQWGGDIR